MAKGTRFVIGMDLGDRAFNVCVLNRATGEISAEGEIGSTREDVDLFFRGLARARVVMECGSHSPWVSRAVEGLGREVVVADARRLRAIWDSPKKNDVRDAQVLAQLGAGQPGLLHAIRHRDERTQAHLCVLRARERVVECRTSLVTAARGMVKSLGHRLPACDAASFHHRAADAVPEELRPALMPLLEAIGALTATIRGYDREIEELCKEHPATQRLQEIAGVGPVTSLAFVLVLGEPTRFTRSRDVGAYLGIVPRQDKSGTIDKQLRISKCGDRMVRRLLVQCAHRILGPFGADSDLRRWGLALAERGGKNAKKRATVAVARKLAVLLHALWVKKRPYVPLRSVA
jgi:transposase